MSELAFFLKKLLTALALPPLSLLLCILLGLLAMRRWPRFGKVLAWGGLVTLLVLALPWTATTLVRAVALDSAVTTPAAAGAQAVVILGGGRRIAPEYGGMTVSSAALERIRYGALLARERKLPILVTGGAVMGEGPTEAALMAQALRESFGSQVQWLEEESRDTHENAVLSAAMLRAAGIQTILLVTHDLHQRRAKAEFEAAGLVALPAPVTTVRAAARGNLPAQLPNTAALAFSVQALHEMLGILVLAPGTATAP